MRKTPTNVVPFDPMRRGGMARRGSPDKTGRAPREAVVLECPSCASELTLEARWLEDEAGVLCGGCEAEISFSCPPQESVR